MKSEGEGAEREGKKIGAGGKGRRGSRGESRGGGWKGTETGPWRGTMRSMLVCYKRFENYERVI